MSASINQVASSRILFYSTKTETSLQNSITVRRDQIGAYMC